LKGKDFVIKCFMSESWLFKVWTDNSICFLLLKHILPVFFSVWECSPWPISNVREVPWRLSMMSSVMGSDIYKLFKWLFRGREMPQGQHRSLMHTCAGKQRGENCYLPNTNIYQTLTPLESLQETSWKKKKKALAAGFTATIINRSMKTGKNTKHSIPIFWVRCKFPQKKVKRCFISPHCCNQSFWCYVI